MSKMSYIEDEMSVDLCCSECGEPLDDPFLGDESLGVCTNCAEATISHRYKPENIIDGELTKLQVKLKLDIHKQFVEIERNIDAAFDVIKSRVK